MTYRLCFFSVTSSKLLLYFYYLIFIFRHQLISFASAIFDYNFTRSFFRCFSHPWFFTSICSLLNRLHLRALFLGGWPFLVFWRFYLGGFSRVFFCWSFLHTFWFCFAYFRFCIFTRSPRFLSIFTAKTPRKTKNPLAFSRMRLFCFFFWAFKDEKNKHILNHILLTEQYYLRVIFTFWPVLSLLSTSPPWTFLRSFFSNFVRLHEHPRDSSTDSLNLCFSCNFTLATHHTTDTTSQIIMNIHLHSYHTANIHEHIAHNLSNLLWSHIGSSLAWNQFGKQIT